MACCLAAPQARSCQDNAEIQAHYKALAQATCSISFRRVQWGKHRQPTRPDRHPHDCKVDVMLLPLLLLVVTMRIGMMKLIVRFQPPTS